ncbi:FtsX-like permease family protein [Microbispora siamensis]|uniref:ABC transporter permease n=1 Tax=Microbispora siamensis TaxID=564413 RepID=A0ABQ4GEF6_9ACTN|nr:FtsX-like permease family protein [Microbispora siamensis]GIH59812.1 ABC transporter permease [Microbispora siamensis]
MTRRVLSRRALSLAWSTIKGRKGGFVAAFVAVAFGSAVLTASGILLETGLSSGVPAERYRAAEVVAGAPQTFPVAEDVDPRYSERVRLPAGRVEQVRRVHGVRAAVGDVSVPMSLVTKDGRVLAGPDGAPLLGHGWPAAVLTPFALTAGRQPQTPDEVVLESRLAEEAGVSVGGTVTLAVGTTSSVYRVAGLVTPRGGPLTRQGALFLTEDRARSLTGQPDRVDTVGVLAAPGADPDELAADIEKAVRGVVTYTGDERGDAEMLDVGATRAFVIELALSFGATMVMVVVIVVAGTLALSVQQRRRELALLRAIGATPKQVLAMIGAEATLVSAAGAVAGAVPGIALGFLFHRVFAAVGVLPEDFELVVGPLPVLAAMLLCVAGARMGGWIAARRAAKVSPIEAIGEAAVEPRKLGWVRLTIGSLLVPAALAAAVVLPIALPGESAVEGASSSAFLLVVAVALLGPRLLTGAVVLLGPRLNRGRGASGFLAVANARARSRRLSSATTPLIMGVTMAAAQIFSATTLSAAAQDQVVDGLRAGYVVTPAAAGLSPELAGVLRKTAGVSDVTPVVRTQTLITYADGDSRQYKIFPTQGVEPGGIAATMDLGVLRGDLAGLSGEAVALSRMAAGTVGADVGGTVDLRLGDGTPVRARVVAIYEKGLGFGDVTLPHDLVIRHTTDRLDSWMLVRATGGDAGLRQALAAYPTARVADRESFMAAQDDAEAGGDAVGLILNAVLLGYIAIAVVNTLVMATAARVREFAMLRLIGARREQVLSMMRGEARIITVAAVLIGTLAALPSLAGIGIAVSRRPLPSIPPLAYAGIVVAAVLVAWPSIMISARVAMRRRPVETIGAE